MSPPAPTILRSEDQMTLLFSWTQLGHPVGGAHHWAGDLQGVSEVCSSICERGWCEFDGRILHICCVSTLCPKLPVHLFSSCLPRRGWEITYGGTLCLLIGQILSCLGARRIIFRTCNRFDQSQSSVIEFIWFIIEMLVLISSRSIDVTGAIWTLVSRFVNYFVALK